MDVIFYSILATNLATNLLSSISSNYGVLR